MYKECHILTHAAVRLRGDELVNKAINNKLNREVQLARKSITVDAEERYLAGHINGMHTVDENDKSVNCNYCEYSTNHEANLNNHMKSLHMKL